MDLTAFADEVGSVGPVTIVGRGTRGGAVRDVRCVTAPTGIEWIQADEMTVGCGAGTPIDELDAALREVGQRSVLPAGGTVGGALAMGRSGVRRLGDGPMRDILLQTRYVGADGSVVKAGGPTVKNVSGFDVCRLLVGSQGTLGFLGDVIVRTRPIALSSRWFVGDRRDPFAVLAAAYRPVSVRSPSVMPRRRCRGIVASSHPAQSEPRSIRCPAASSWSRWVSAWCTPTWTSRCRRPIRQLPASPAG
ncbi:MAG: putative oxidase [Acidimicrobiaceae bacterium]|nr:MAG: putative oxidase [Acidimicrobiaceae bacterium]